MIIVSRKHERSQEEQYLHDEDFEIQACNVPVVKTKYRLTGESITFQHLPLGAVCRTHLRRAYIFHHHQIFLLPSVPR